MRFGLKRNNKGNTLGMVLVGILILSILGTLILGVTATNYKMKVNEKNSETSFYYAEKAIDDIYAGIGNDVMTAIKESYTNILETYVVSGATTNKDIANDKFVEDVRNKITNLYKSDTTYVPALLTDLDADINKVSGYKYKVYSPSGSSTEVKYYKKEIDASGAEIDVAFVTGTDPVTEISKVIIKNVGLSCESRLGYSSRIITDFEIRIPNVEVDFTDSAVSGSIEDLCQYSIISEGFNLQPDKFSVAGGVNRNKSAIKINNDANVNIKGNIYAGGIVYNATETKTPASATVPNFTYYINNVSSIFKKLPAIEVGDDAKLNINAKIINCESDFILGNNTEVKLRNLSGDDNSVDQLDSLQFYTGNIYTSKNTTGAKLDIVGNCIVKDDLEINGNNSSVKLKGNYFGYGFRDRDDDNNEDNSTELTANLGFESKPLVAEENEESSAIIINGTGADLDMSQVGKLVLAGRAYIDLDGSGTKNTYMTGESISLKGNQQMYMADDTELNGSSVMGNNPIKFSVLQSLVPSTLLNSDANMTSSYDSLGISSANVIAKRIDDDVFFYRKNEKPDDQTTYFMNQYQNNLYKRSRMIDQAAKLGVVRLSINPLAKIYSVGTVITVDTASGQTEITSPASGENGITKVKFDSILKSIKNRKENLTPSLNDVSKSYILGDADDIVSVVSSDVSPYEYYINRSYMIEKFGGSRLTVEIDLQNLNSDNTYLSSDFYGKRGLSLEQQKDLKNNILNILGDSYKTKKVGYVISCESGAGGSAIELDAGVIVSECPYTINKDFKGLILSGDEMYISGEISIEAAADLAELLFKKCPQLKAILNPEFQSDGEDGTGSVVNVASLKYTDLVDKTNWRKDN